MKAARCEPTDVTPVWIMRQAGRYMPEYMAVRSQVTFLELCKRPDLAAEVTVVAQRVLGVDAAILFADLLPILEPMGFELEYQPDEGPVIHNPLSKDGNVDRVRAIADLGSLEFVFDTVKLVRKELPADIPLLGFAGAPFTLASYAIEGGGSRNYVHTKKLMYGDRGAWDALMGRLVDTVAAYLIRQIESGCQAVQVFDSWVGCLCPSDYREYVLPHTRRLFGLLPADVPTIHFLTGNPALLSLQAEAGGTVIGLDWRCDLAESRQLMGPQRAVQGNLDPVTLMAEPAVLKQKAEAVLAAGSTATRDKPAVAPSGPGDSVTRHRAPGHIFNLGHGVLPGTPVENVKRLVEWVHGW
ncbi:MAG: uroporphyrinogen decarboxylase [Planctomycetaceae bacterium]